MTQLFQNLSTVSRSVSSLPLLIRTGSSMAFWSLANATTKTAAAATVFLSELASNRLILFVRHTEEVAVRTTTQVASGMMHPMAVGIWIWGSSFLFPQALIPVNSGWKGLLAIGLRHFFAALKAAVGVFSLGVLKAHTC